jgi:hypothetical protein
MTIHTTAPEKETFVRVELHNIAHRMVDYHGCVGKVIAEGDWGDSSHTVVIVNIVGEPEEKVFNGRDLTEISKKEYFQEALKSG